MLALKELLSTPTAQLGKAGRFAVFQIKLWSHCIRLLKKNNAGRQAAALSYHTVFGIVPLAIVTLLIFQLFPAYSDIGEKVKKFVYDQANFSAFESLAPDTEDTQETVTLTEHLDEIVGKFFTGVNKGSITIFSVVIVIWAALALLSTVERTFNNIWHVPRGRNFLNRIINYWAILTLGPLLLGLGVYASAQYATLAQLQKTLLTYIAPMVVSYIVAIVAFFFLYFVLPNTKVQAKAAIWGAAVAALVWIAAKSIFGYSVTELKLYSTVYGVMALVPMTVLWIYITWLTVLFGLQLTFTTQHLRSLDAAEIAGTKQTEEYFIANDLTAINIVREIAVAFMKNQAPVPPEVICSKLDIPPEFGDKILGHLVNSGLIAKTSEPKVGFLPAKDPENIRLSDIAEAIAAAGFAQSTTDQSQILEQINQSQRSMLAQCSLKQILNVD
ncbi:MAG: YihY family inner membrane protein [Planctomycetes bacterium]|nr:YihY family inner membrane protein [Planctomycetota bacterium]MCH8120287.1 YihY family inner membrane protein [Planctomycetota bacterium]